MSVSIFLHRLEKSERTLSTFSLFSLPIALYLNLFKVSVRYRFPAQARGKCARRVDQEVVFFMVPAAP